jgi:hypothetical protein
MTIALERDAQTTRVFAFRHLLTAFLLGAVLATAAALFVVMPRTLPADAATVARPSTTATEQYRSWFGRPTERVTAPTSASEQYVSWYLRPMAAGSSTATEQYLDWYLRASMPSEQDR